MSGSDVREAGQDDGPVLRGDGADPHQGAQECRGEYPGGLSELRNVWNSRWPPWAPGPK